MHNALPPENCTCASFFTVRGTHKKDCPVATHSQIEAILKETYLKSLYQIPQVVDDIMEVISSHFIPRERVVEEVKKLKRTDDTQISDDHVYDDALEDLARALLEDRNKE